LDLLDYQPPTPIPLLEQELAPLLACFSVRLRLRASVIRYPGILFLKEGRTY